MPPAASGPTTSYGPNLRVGISIHSILHDLAPPLWSVCDLPHRWSAGAHPPHRSAKTG